MKKILSLILVAVTIFSMCQAFAGLGTVSAAGTTLGDLNNDGSINSKDSLLMKRYVAGKISSGLNTAAADVTADGRVNTLDLRQLKAVMTGAADSFEDADANVAVNEIQIGGEDISTFEIVLLECTEFPDIGVTYTNSDNANYGFPTTTHPDYPAYHLAGRLLRNYINDANGYQLNLTYNESKQNQIYLIYNDQDYGKEGYRWQTYGGDVYITGGTRRGCLYGALDLLREYVGLRSAEYAKRYYLPNDIVSIPMGIDYTFEPVFGYRDVHNQNWSDSWEKGFEPDPMGQHCSINHINSHTDRNVLLGPKYSWGDGNTYINAHSFQYVFGIAWDQQPCLSDPAKVSTAVAWANNLIAERSTWGGYLYGYNITRVSMSWNDNENFCSCATCKATYTNECAISGAIVLFNNKVRAELDKTYPEIELYYIAYGSSRIPPKNARPVGKQVICYCWNGCNNHTFDSDECTARGSYLGHSNWEERYMFEAWSRIADYKLFTWYYQVTFNFYISPCPNILNIREDFRYLADHGVDGIYAEGVDCRMNLEGLRDYLIAQCIYDPYMSEEEFDRHMNEYLERVYGDGWRYIKEYVYFADEAGNRKTCFTNNHDWAGDMYDLTYMYQNYDYLVSLINNAYALAQTDSERTRIEQLSMHIHFLCISGAFYTGHGNDSVIQSRYSTLWDLVIKHDFKTYVGWDVQTSRNTSQSPLLTLMPLSISGSWFDENRVAEGDVPAKWEQYLPNQAAPTKTYNPFANIN